MRSRTEKFTISLLSGYIALCANIVYSLVSIPMALHYLSKQEFGLWVLINQLSSSLMLLEFGMSGSIARHLSIHKEDMNKGSYGSVMITGFYFFLGISAIMFIVGLVVIYSLPLWTYIPSVLSHPFYIVSLIQLCVGSMTLILRSFGSALWSHQRLEINNYASIITLIANFLVLLVGFNSGIGIYAFALSSVSGFLIGNTIVILACLKLKLYPQRGCWGGFNKQIFREMLQYGSGLFILNLGMQMASASQAIIVSRTIGLESTSIWVVATKLSSMMQLFVNRIFETSAAGLLEMKVRDEISRLLVRSRDLFTLTCVVAGAGAIGLALFNSSFLNFWTAGKISWSSPNDYLLGVVVLASCSSRFLIGLASLGKDVHKVKYVCLLEGLVFVLLSFALAGRFGLSGILISSIISGISVNLVSSIYINSSSLSVSFSLIAEWMWKPWLLTLCLIGLHFMLVPLAKPSILMYFVQVAAYACIILPVYWFFCVPIVLRNELYKVFSKITSGFKLALSSFLRI